MFSCSGIVKKMPLICHAVFSHLPIVFSHLLACFHTSRRVFTPFGMFSHLSASFHTFWQCFHAQAFLRKLSLSSMLCFHTFWRVFTPFGHVSHLLTVKINICNSFLLQRSRTPACVSLRNDVVGKNLRY